MFNAYLSDKYGRRSICVIAMSFLGMIGYISMSASAKLDSTLIRCPRISVPLFDCSIRALRFTVLFHYGHLRDGACVSSQLFTSLAS
jgi:hypothetical protein